MKNTITQRMIKAEIQEAARKIAIFANKSMFVDDYEIIGAMIGGAPFLMASLEEELKKENVTVLYSFSERRSVEKIMDDGSVQKTAVFKHCGFIEV